jgi:Phage protein Gp138 N-terminal domain
MFERTLNAFQDMAESQRSEMNTSMPGTIVSYDATTNRAVVRPDLPKRLASNEALPPPNIVEVPIVWTTSSGGKSGLTMPVKPGDGVMLAFQQRSLEGWLSGNKDMPDDPRQFDLSDCVAIPGCSATGVSADPTDVVLRFNETEVRITPDNNVRIGNNNGFISIDSDGNIIVQAKSLNLQADTIQVNAGGHSFTLETHRHTGVQVGIATSGTPI